MSRSWPFHFLLTRTRRALYEQVRSCASTQLWRFLYLLMGDCGSDRAIGEGFCCARVPLPKGPTPVACTTSDAAPVRNVVVAKLEIQPLPLSRSPWTAGMMA